MKKILVKPLVKSTIFAILWAIFLFILALIIVKVTDYKLNDILFIEGISFIIIGVLSSLGGNPMGLPIQSMGQNNSQYVSNANLEITKREKENVKTNVKEAFNSSINIFSFVLAGIVCIIINFLI